MGKRHEAALRAKPVLQKAAQSLDDTEAMTVKGIYPQWLSGVSYGMGEKAQHKGKLYRCLQPHTSQDGWTPELAPSLWFVIDEEHKGTINDPIPYSGNMTLEAGKYYSEDGVVYYCNRGTVNPVYSPLKDLVGLYVEAIK